VNKPRSILPLAAVAVVALLFLSAAPAHAGLSTTSVTDAIVGKFQTAAAQWEPAILGAATTLFRDLAIISLVVTLAFLALKRAELGEIVAELIRYTLFTGFWYWILQNGPAFFQLIVRSLWQLGGQASGAAQGLSVSTVVNLTLQIYRMDAGQMSLFNMADSFMACFLGILVLILGTIMAANLIRVMCSAWIVAYGGAIVLGFGGCRWTSDVAAAYLRAALAIGLKVMTLALVTGLGISFLQSVINLQGAGAAPKVAVGDLALLTIAMGILTILAVSLPGTVASLATGGGHAGQGIGMLGAGTAWMAAQFAGRMTSGGANQKGQGQDGGKTSAVENAVRSAENTISGTNGGRKGVTKNSNASTRA
jgi:type IV secretion system protein TrbL